MTCLLILNKQSYESQFLTKKKEKDILNH